MLSVLVHPTGRPVPSLGPACSSCSRCHGVSERACWDVPRGKVLAGGGTQRVVNPLPPTGGAGWQVREKSQQGFLLGVFLGRKSMLERYEWGGNITPESLKISIFPRVLWRTICSIILSSFLF